MPAPGPTRPTPPVGRAPIARPPTRPSPSTPAVTLALPATEGWTHLSALDGIRAVAVGAVLVFHGEPDWLPGGFLGVDVFFVLSGFLITGLLLAERRRTGRVRLAPFWGRRARRLLPALLLVLSATAVAGRLALPPELLGGLRADALAAMGYVANWRMIFRGGDYFTRTAGTSWLQHTWSLGIEEQFYLLWPLLVLLALTSRRHAKRALLLLCGAGIGGSALLSAVLFDPGADPSRVYYGTDTRAGGLLVGCALAVLLGGRLTRPGDARARRLTGGLAALGAAALLLSLAVASGADTWLYRGGLTGLALAVAAILGHLAVAPDGWVARLLSVPPLAWLGRLSYGVYLWHWPLFQLLTADRTGLSGPVLFAARVAGTLVLATVSYHLIEQPIRRRVGARPDPRVRRHRTSGGLLAYRWGLAGTVLVAMLAATAVVVTVTAGTPPTTTAAAADDAPLAPGGPAGTRTVRPTAPPAGRAVPPVNRPGRRPGALPRVTILGDSVAWTVGAYLPAHPQLAIGNRAIQGCGIARLPDIVYIGTPHTNYPGCDAWDGRWRKAVDGDDPDVAVILLDRWELMDRRLDGEYRHVGQPEFDAYLTKELITAITIAGSHGGRVVLLTAPYTHRQERPDGGLYPEDDPARVDAWNRLLHTVADRSPAHPTILDLNRLVCPDGRFTWTIGGHRVRSDGLHFTPYAVSDIVAPWLLPRLTALATTA